MSTPLGLRLRDGRACDFITVFFLKIPEKAEAERNTRAWSSAMTPAFIRTEKKSKIRVLCPETPPVSLSPDSCTASRIIFGILQVQDHAPIPIMQAGEKLFVFSSPPPSKEKCKIFLKRNAKNVFQKQQSCLEKQRMRPRQLGKYRYFLLIVQSTVLCYYTAVRSLEELKNTLIFTSHLQGKQYPVIQCSWESTPAWKLSMKI